MATKEVERLVKMNVRTCDFCGKEHDKNAHHWYGYVEHCSQCNKDICGECVEKKGDYASTEDYLCLCPKCLSDGYKIKEKEEDGEPVAWIVKPKKHV